MKLNERKKRLCLFVDQSIYKTQNTHTRCFSITTRYLTLCGFTSKTRSQLKRLGHYKTQRTRREHREREWNEKVYLLCLCAVVIDVFKSYECCCWYASAYRNVRCRRSCVGVSVFVSMFCVARAMFLCDVFLYFDLWIFSECTFEVSIGQ